MAEYKIITDSTTDLYPALIERMDVDVIPMVYTVGEKVYHNTPDEKELSAHDFYNLLKEGATSTTSQVNQITFIEKFEPYLEKGIDVLYLGFSSGLSGTFNSARLACEEMAEKYPQRKCIAVDTLAASMGEGLLVYLACEKRNAGMGISELAQWVTDNRNNMAHWFTVDDLNHLKRGGRVSGAAAFFGTMLNIKPVLHVDNEGHLIPKEKVRGRKASLDALVQHMEETAIDPASQTVFISHGDCEEEAKYVKEQIRKKFKTKEIYINTIGPVIGSHSGPGTMALFFLANTKG